ncbi:DUF1559 domain-containing protein, partial [Singulisphaera rosea]
GLRRGAIDLVGKDELVIAARTALAEQALALAGRESGRWAPNGPFVAMAKQIPKGLIFLKVNDLRETLPTQVASIPAMLKVINPLIQREAAKGNPAGGVPAGPGFSIQVSPDLMPTPQELQKFLFPGSFSITTDPQGVRFVARESFPSTLAPQSASLLVGLFLPAVQAAREAAKRTSCLNNLREIGRALHKYESAHGALPPAAIADKQGKPLLSWRVELLPFLGEKELYDQFKRDEPWDSPHNRTLLLSRPKVFACLGNSSRARTETTYRAFVGNGAFWNATSENPLRAITDGTSTTIAVVEASEAVPWTKPEDLTFEPKRAEGLLGAGSFHPGGFNALFGDGSVRFLKLSTAPEIFRNLITRAGGEVIAPDSF